MTIGRRPNNIGCCRLIRAVASILASIFVNLFGYKVNLSSCRTGLCIRAQQSRMKTYRTSQSGYSIRITNGGLFGPSFTGQSGTRQAPAQRRPKVSTKCQWRSSKQRTSAPKPYPLWPDML